MKTKLLFLLLLTNFSIYAQTNLVANGGFENWISNSPKNWIITNSVSSSTDKAEGQYSAKLSLTDKTLAPKVTAQVLLKAGVTYTIKFKYKYISSNYSGLHPIALKIFQNGSANTISKSYFATDNNWTPKEITFTPDVDLSYELSISVFSFDDDTFNVLIDDVSIVNPNEPVSQYTLIPDVNFENKLIASGIDTGIADGKVLTSNISSVTTLDLDNSLITDLTGIEDFTSLEILKCSQNQLKSINISQNTKLTELEVSENQLTILDITSNVLLKFLDCQKNQIINLNINNNTALKKLNCANNNITSLNTSNNTLLTSFGCHYNKITSLDVSKNLLLTEFVCVGNKLTTINVSKNPELNIFDCYENQITSIDISKNTKITEFACNNNQLTYLNVKNGNNINFKLYYTNYTNNPNLTCILVDDVDYSNGTWYDKKDTKASFNTNCAASYTLIPDINFENKLISLGIDSGVPDGKVLTADITSVKNLDLSNSSITDLTGIEAFKELVDLNVNNNQLISLNLSANTKLLALSAQECTLKNIDLKANTLLGFLALTKNELTALDISSNTKLTGFHASGNKLKNINLSANILLEHLSLSENELTTLDISANTNLIGIFASKNKLKNIDVKTHTLLQVLILDENELTTLDLSSNPKLYWLKVNNNKLTSLNIKNGKNNLLTDISFLDNPDLKCIQVDDENYSNKNWIDKKDAIATFSAETCPIIVLYTLIPDANFEKRLIELGIDSGEVDGKVLTSKIAAVKSLKVDPTVVSDLTGLEDFAALQELDCSNGCISTAGGGCGKITALNVSKNTLLTSLNCQGNKITNLDLSQNTKLMYLSCQANLLTSLEVSKNTELRTARFSNNRLTEFNTSKNLLLYDVEARENKLTSLDLTNNIYLSDLDCTNNEITSLGISKHPLLRYIHIARNKITSLDLTDKPRITDIDCSSNLITSLDVSQLTKLEKLNCTENKLSILNITQNKELTVLNCGFNALPEIDFTKNIKLTELGCPGLNLNELNVSNLPDLKKLTADSNNLKTLDVSNNLKLTDLSLGKNQFTKIDVTKNILLTALYVSDNKLTELNPANNPALLYITCINNSITSLDISSNKKLLYVNCNNNKLTYLNLKNGNKALYIDLTTANYKNNPDLKCIQVTDEKSAKSNWSYYADPNVRFSEDCGGPLTVVPDNFSVETKGESCLGENNGEINITTKEKYNYQAIISGKTYAFTNYSLKVSSLTPGSYPVSITIPGENFEQNFTITIAKGATIAGNSNTTGKKTEVEITAGTAPFTVFIDGTEQFQTNEAVFSVDLTKNALVEVTTAKACEGIFAKKVSVSDFDAHYQILSAYPNPTSGSFEIEIPTAKNEVTIELYNFSGQLISAKTYVVESGKAQLNLENQPSGIYAAKIYLDTPEYIKIIKK